VNSNLGPLSSRKRAAHRDVFFQSVRLPDELAALLARWTLGADTSSNRSGASGQSNRGDSVFQDGRQHAGAEVRPGALLRLRHSRQPTFFSTLHRVHRRQCFFAQR